MTEPPGASKSLASAERLAGPLYGLLLAIGLLTIWIAPRPPMIDLPQHAGQVALLRDLVQHRSPWAGELRINLFTPYLIGYGLALPLAFIMPVAAAMKLVLSAAFLGFAAASRAIARHLGAAKTLDAYPLIGFFGFAYGWGLYTFLVAAPVGLAFILLGLRYARAPSTGKAVGLSALGAVLLFCHGLVFILCVGVGGLLYLVNTRSVRALFDYAWPYVVLVAGCGAYVLISREMEKAGVGDPAATRIDMGAINERLALLTVGPFDNTDSHRAAVLFLALTVLPLAAGLRIRPTRERLAIAGGVFGVLMLCPLDAWATNLLYPRFTLFLLPAYAWLFEPRAAPGRPSPTTRALMTYGVHAAAVFAVGMHTVQAALFARESRAFEQVLAAAQPGQRALSLVIDPKGGAGIESPYLHFPLWYQAEKHGFVEFNFAWYLPQIARYRTIDAQTVRPYLALKPLTFDWRRQGGERYRYIFVRSGDGVPNGYWNGAACSPALAAQAGPWMLFENRPCPSTSP